jgi:integrase
VLRTLSPTGSLWVAIGAEYQAEVCVLLKAFGLYWRNTVAWHYAFGPCQQKKFTRSWAALHYFTREPDRFTFNADAVRVPSARQTVYGDRRTNPKGKPPDDVWLLRPQDDDRFFRSPATVNKELRHLRAALKKARKWGYLTAAPDFDLEREPKRLPTYVSAEHFAAIYQACDQATMPTDQAYPAADRWRALLVTGYMTGWRISDMLGLRREDLDLTAGTAITRCEDNKGKRDELVKLHPVVVDHVKKLSGFSPTVFPWAHNRKTLQTEFAKIQEAAKINLPCRGQHEHTRFCRVYGFHDLRRAFATMNAAKLTPDALQTLMRHKSYLTTQRYINMTRQLDEAVAVLHVPEVLRAAKG